MAHSSAGRRADEGPAGGPIKHLPEVPELEVIIEGLARPGIVEKDKGLSLLSQYQSVLPAHRKSTQRLPSTLKQTPGDRVFDRDEVNEVNIGVEKRLEEETVDNDHAFSRRLDGANRTCFAETQNSKSTYQETAPGTGEDPGLNTGRRLKTTKKRTVLGKTVINKTTTRKEDERGTTSPTGKMDYWRTVDEAGTTQGKFEIRQEEVVEEYDEE